MSIEATIHYLNRSRLRYFASVLVPALIAGAGGVYLVHEIAWRQAEIQQLREAMAVQTVQLHDARERIHALEVDMDHVAPHTPRQSP